jgi:hypothetical protein
MAPKKSEAGKRKAKAEEKEPAEHSEEEAPAPQKKKTQTKLAVGDQLPQLELLNEKDETVALQVGGRYCHHSGT